MSKDDPATMTAENGDTLVKLFTHMIRHPHPPEPSMLYYSKLRWSAFHSRQQLQVAAAAAAVQLSRGLSVHFRVIRLTADVVHMEERRGAGCEYLEVRRRDARTSCLFPAQAVDESSTACGVPVSPSTAEKTTRYDFRDCEALWSRRSDQSAGREVPLSAGYNIIVIDSASSGP